MGKNCCGPVEDVEANNDPLWRRILWIALILNAVMFSVEIVAGLAADSRALQADALDFLGDAANYAISLGVAGMALAWRAQPLPKQRPCWRSGYGCLAPRSGVSLSVPRRTPGPWALSEPSRLR